MNERNIDSMQVSDLTMFTLLKLFRIEPVLPTS